MTSQPPWATPSSWSNQAITLFHGTLAGSADSIVQNGVLLTGANPDADFGLGFYTTTLRRQAEAWAYVKVAEAAAGGQSVAPGVVGFTVERDDLARLDSLWFVRGEFDADDFWSLVFHCRTGGAGHGRGTKNDFYDVVVGPVAAFWRQRVALQGYDQISFHTCKAVDVLNKDRARRTSRVL